MTSPTPNKGYTYPAHGGAVNAWDAPLNVNFDYIDLNVGGTYNLSFGSSIAGATFNSTYATLSSTVTTVTFPSSIAENFFYKCSGALSANATLTFPAVGSFYVIKNNTTGGFTVSANTVAGGSSSKIIPASAMMVASDGTDILNVTEFPSGTRLAFQQTTPPAGWTKDTTYNDYAIRIVSGTVGSSGSLGFTTAFANRNTSNDVGVGVQVNGTSVSFVVAQHTHIHTLDMSVLYVDFIIAQKAA